MSSDAFIPYARQQIDEDDIAAVMAVLKSDFLTTGPVTGDFENKLAEATGAKFAVACSSGTAGLHLAALALSLKPGDKVIVPSLTFLATANAVRYLGADVVFADVDPDNGLMGGENLVRAIERGGEGIKAVFPVHLAGQCADMVEISVIAAGRNLAIVEDACHAIGAAYNNDTAGSCVYGDMAVFSFHPVKTITMGEGGAVTTNNEALGERLRLLRNHGMTRGAGDFVHRGEALAEDGSANTWYYEMQEMGLNYRPSDIHCALGLSQLKKLDAHVRRRRELAAKYDELLSPLAPLLRPITRLFGQNPAWHLYPVLIDFNGLGMSRQTVMAKLFEAGIGTQVHYIPVHRQPYYRDLYGETDLPGADTYYARELSLPLFPGMSEADAERVAATLEDIING
jgi:UDP-4-amino-4,6-dideoxy-N-acetyl-beta-L-altrosamine transaminase